jgi:hypothetical protein
VEKGFLTFDEIAAALEDVELTKEQSDDFYAHLVDRSIELVEGERHKDPPHEQPALAEDETKAAPKLDLSVEPSLDSLRLARTCTRTGTAARTSSSRGAYPCQREGRRATTEASG